MVLGLVGCPMDSRKDSVMSKKEMITGGQLNELQTWALRLTKKKYQERRDFFRLLTRSSFSPESFKSLFNQKWYEKDGVLYFSVTSDGTTGPQWLERLKANGCLIGGRARHVLNSPNFNPTDSITTKVAVLRAAAIWGGGCTIREVYEKAGRLSLVVPNPEITCLILELLMSDDYWITAIPRWIITMHTPIEDSSGDLCRLVAHCNSDGHRLLSFSHGIIYSHYWPSEYSFAFVVPPETPKVPVPDSPIDNS